jgi:hypothetical protein
MPLRPTSAKEKLKLSLELSGPRKPEDFQNFAKELDAVLKKFKAKVTTRFKETRK